MACQILHFNYGILQFRKSLNCTVINYSEGVWMTVRAIRGHMGFSLKYGCGDKKKKIICLRIKRKDSLLDRRKPENPVSWRLFSPPSQACSTVITAYTSVLTFSTLIQIYGSMHGGTKTHFIRRVLSKHSLKNLQPTSCVYDGAFFPLLS